MLRGFAFAAALIAASVGAVPAAEDTRIRTVRIQHEDVFAPDEKLDPPGLPDLTPVFDLANKIHFETREHVIRRELLFQEGDPLDRDRIAESERNLRQLNYLRQAWIVTRPVGPGLVDVIVHVQDTWTTEPRLSISGGGGQSTSEYGIVEKNLFGFGKTIALRHREQLDRTSDQFLYDDPRILGSRWHFTGNYEDRSDGSAKDLLLEYPFFSLLTPWATSSRFSHVKEENRIFAPDGIEVNRFVRDQDFFEASVGHRLEFSTEEVVHRAGLFYRLVDDEFSPTGIGSQPTLVPPDRRESQPGLFYRREGVRFVAERHFNRFDRVEDLNLGNIFDVRFGYSTRALDALDDEPILRASNRQGFDFGPGRKAFLFALVSGRHADGDVRNGIVEVEAISYNRFQLLFEQTLVTRAKLDLGRNLDPDVQLFLGSENGLRGYSTREFVGSKRLAFNVEDRIFFVNDLFHLVSLGAVLFFDAGYAWAPGQEMRLNDLASSVGIGLRIGAPRAAEEKIWRFDFAVPLSTAGGKHLSPDFSFGSRQAFGPFSGPFDLQTSSGD
jgi:hypothetical protein